MPDTYVNVSSAPVYPETMEAGHVRYAAALQDIADRHCSRNILVVTHGEAVRQSVARVVRRNSLVFSQLYLVAGFSDAQYQHNTKSLDCMQALQIIPAGSSTFYVSIP